MLLNNFKRCCFLLTFVCLLGMLGFGCGTTGGKEKLNQKIGKDDIEIGGYESVGELVREPVLLNLVVRRMGLEFPVSAALLNGVESRWVQIDKPAKEWDKLLLQVVSATGLVCQSERGYYFLYPPDFPMYELLALYPLAEKMPSRFKDIKISASFGVGTKLYNVFNSLNFAYGCNIVADNTLAELPIGEVVANQLSLDLFLDMVIKSARISPQTLRMCVREDFVFLYTTLNNNISELESCECFNERGLDERLKKRVSLNLPEIIEKGRSLPFYDSAKPLKDVAKIISAQLGIGVELQPGTEELPINPLYISNVSVETALNLIVFQWLENAYGYVFENGKVKFVFKG
ncbi:MAG: hypothetical protein N3G21_11590 [Candidatus Hydrogenedentes bacterium]|nr:hypothetical protein [Candidatus Hydrogenedentota bacterium]